MKKHTFKVNYLFNGQYAFSVFICRTKDELNKSIARWKAEHITAYNKVEILWFGTLDKWEEEQGDLKKHLIKKR